MKSNSKSSLIPTIIGIICIALVLLINQFTWSVFFDPDSLLSNSTKVSIFLNNLFLIVLGIIILFYRKNKKKFVYTLLLMGLMVFSLEVSLRIGHYAISLISTNDQEFSDKRYLLSPYHGKDWALDYFIEFNELPSDYEQFLGWDRREYHGKYINIDSLGIRRTWNPPVKSNKNNNRRTIYMFGGSTMWGTGARDHYTIPSHLSKILHENNYKFEVTNYGESSYMFLQEIIHLALLLREGHRPDFVFFYDGINDVYGAYQNGIAGQSIDIERTRKILQTSNPSNMRQMKNIILHITSLRWAKIYRSTLKLYNYVFSPEYKFPEMASNYSKFELEELGRNIVDHYKKSINLLDNLSQVYGFKYLALWQPTIYTEKNITDEESTVDIRVNDKSLEILSQHVNHIHQRENINYFYNISDVLKDRNETFYIDYGHLSEEGNRTVAYKIYSLFKKEFLANE